MPAGERCTADVLDIVVQRKGRSVTLADELRAPAGVAHFAAARFPIVEDPPRRATAPPASMPMAYVISSCLPITSSTIM